MTQLNTTTPASPATDRALIERVARASELRAAIREPALLLAEAERVLRLVPDECDTLLAWSDEGYAVAAAASVLAAGRGTDLALERASHLAPLAPAPALAWSWASVEQLLGLGEVRPWARQWADDRGGRPLPVAARSDFELVA